ncbi:MAG: hypothetical protein H7A25_03740 [Leptospiraceae bacterium]|nr:hypothetical protein [Leptospiraceae bacterium]MCP5498987.1 hypothetical protein [Leptospiraceae bacterium]
MNQKTAKLIRKYALLKGMDEEKLKKSLKREWQAMNKFQKDKHRQDMIQALIKK